ncbi:mediator complex subunit Med20 [Chamberlinius hualienensis]
MGVVFVQQYQIPEGKNGLQMVEQLQKRLEALGAVRSGTFCVDCETYFSAVNTIPQRTVHVIRNSEQPTTCFALTDTGLCLIADLLYESLMNKLVGIYNPKKAIKIESKGSRYELSDFLVKIGSVSMGSSFKGILIEVEYMPCCIPANCFELMKEFVHGTLHKSLLTTPPYLVGRMDQMYTPTDTVHQYMEHFNHFRKNSNVAR